MRVERGVCARWTGCECAAARASEKVCLEGERRGQAGRQLSRRVGGDGLPARSRAVRSFRDPLPAQLSDKNGRRVWSKGCGPEWDAHTRAGPHGPHAPGKLLLAQGLSFPTRDGRQKATEVTVHSAEIPRVGNPAADHSLALAAALSSGKCRGLPGRPLRGQVAVGNRTWRRQGLRPQGRTLAVRLHGRVQLPSLRERRRGWLAAVAHRLCRNSSTTGKGRERKEVLPS